MDIQITTINNDFQHSGKRKHVDGIVIHSMAKYFHRDILRGHPYYLPDSIVDEFPDFIFAPDFLSIVGKWAKQPWLKGSADFFVERHGIGYEWGYDKITWHAGQSEWGEWNSLNKNFLGFECLVGEKPFKDYGEFLHSINTNKKLFTEEMYKTLAFKTIEQMVQHQIHIDNVITHKMCAGDHVRGKDAGKQDPGDVFDWPYFKRLLIKI
ncbi:MAG: N-acetylmuramoyl-L-alanine amidase [Cyclobacteriaceae bacterium]